MQYLLYYTILKTSLQRRADVSSLTSNGRNSIMSWQRRCWMASVWRSKWRRDNVVDDVGNDRFCWQPYNVWQTSVHWRPIYVIQWRCESVGWLTSVWKSKWHRDNVSWMTSWQRQLMTSVMIKFADVLTTSCRRPMDVIWWRLHNVGCWSEQRRRRDHVVSTFYFGRSAERRAARYWRWYNVGFLLGIDYDILLHNLRFLNTMNRFQILIKWKTKLFFHAIRKEDILMERIQDIECEDVKRTIIEIVGYA